VWIFVCVARKARTLVVYGLAVTVEGGGSAVLPCRYGLRLGFCGIVLPLRSKAKSILRRCHEVDMSVREALLNYDYYTENVPAAQYAK
jgi:hypothetical protein